MSNNFNSHPQTSSANLSETTKPRVLIVEDEEKIARTISSAMQAAGCDSEWERDGAKGLRTALQGGFTLIVLDVMLPGRDGFDILKELRESGSKALILMLTSSNTIEDRLQGLNGGADDYLAKPFYSEELVARVGALLRRINHRGSDESGPVTTDRIKVSNVTLYRLQRLVKVNGEPIELTLREFDLLEYLLRAPGTVRPRAKIFKALWKYGLGSKDHLLDVYIGRLRTKLSDAGAPGLIETVRGVGYRVVVNSSGSE